MIDINTRLIARIKLAELRRQRDQLLQHYGNLEAAAAAAAADPRERLRLLYQGLKEAKFAQKSLHPDVANLEALLFEADLGTASPELLGQWLERLTRELAQGRLRAEFAHLFGHLLDEWMTAADRPDSAAGAGPHPFEETLALLWSAPAQAPDLDFLAGIFRHHDAAFAGVRVAVRAFAENGAQAAASTADVRAVLRLIGDDITRTPDVRRQALAVATDDLQVNEYAGALTVLLNNLDEWDWPAGGFELRPLWSRTRWRPYLDEDLLTLLFQNLVGLRWGMTLKTARHSLGDRRAGSRGLFDKEESARTYDPLRMRRAQQHTKLFLPMIPETLHKLSERGGYGGGYESSGGLTPDTADTFQELLLLVNAEVRLARAASPDQPFHVVQTDLRDYYLRIPHAVVLFLAEQLGFPERWLAFFRKFLAVPVRWRGQVRVVRRGLLLDHVLSDVFADYLLLLMDAHVWREAQVRPMRVVDDVFLAGEDAEGVVRAWRAVGAFCRAAGLEVNEGKTGSVTIGGEAVPDLPPGPPRWGMLRLTAAGEWELDEDSWGRFEAILRRQLGRPMPALTLIALYNSALRYILKFLGQMAPLGRQHRGQIAAAAARMHNGLFGPGHGLLEEVRRRWQGATGGGRHLPEALFYWPLTAGGLGLFNPVLALAASHDAALEWKKPDVPAEGPSGPSFGIRWHSYFQAWLQPVKPRTPVAAPGLEALLDDFASRSGEVSGRAESRGRKRPGAGDTGPRKRRTNLSVYWQWAVYTYGPQLLATLGTFRFLITELVPLQLIVQNRIDASSLSAEGDPGQAGSAGRTDG
jgi:hypothetical protein